MKFLWLFLLCLVLSSCADSSQTKVGASDQVSSIPWNRPEKWEGQGMMNGMGTR